MSTDEITTPSRRRSRARRGEGSRLREEIMEAATRLLLDTGNEEAVSIRAVADAVGVSPPSIYLHFADKTELMFEICQQQFALFAEVFDDVLAVDDPIEGIRAMGRAYIRFGLDHPEAYRILFMTTHTIPEGTPSEDLEGMKVLQRMVEFVTAGMNSGALRPGDPVTTTMCLWGSVHGIVALVIAMKDEPIDLPWPDLDDLIDHQLETCLHGIAAD